MTPRLFVMTSAALLLGVAAFGETPKDASGEWISRYEKYAAQKNIQVEYSGMSRRAAADSPALLGDLLRSLPEPADWPRLRTALVEATARVPAKQELEKQRLQAGAWLLAYLLGDKATVLVEVSAAIPVKSEQDGPVQFGLRSLRHSLTGEDEEPETPGKQVARFEEELLAYEPVDEAAVIKAMGGAENFARLKMLIEAGHAMEGRTRQVYEEFQKTKDEAAARAKLEALQKEFADKYGADQQAIEPFAKDPQVGRYIFGTERTATVQTEEEMPMIGVPDLVAIVGRDRAEALLHRALILPVKLTVAGEASPATRQLLRELALVGMSAAKVPSWGLVQDENGTQLFEAYRLRFPVRRPNDYEYREASGYYVAGLILNGRAADAAKFAADTDGNGSDERFDLPYRLREKIEQTHPEDLWAFLHAWLAIHPAAGEWDLFNRLSVQLGRQAELKTIIQTMAADGSFKGIDRLEVQRLQADAEMATDDLAAATSRLRALIQTPALSEPERKVQLELARRLLKLADLQADPAAFATTLAAAEAVLAAEWTGKPADALQASADLASTLDGLDHFTDGARLGRAALDRIPGLEKENAAKAGPEGSGPTLPDYLLEKLLGEQLRAEVELKQWTAAAALLSDDPHWHVADMAGLLDRTPSSGHNPLGYYVAKLRLAQGDKASARRILEQQIATKPGIDAPYEAYLALAGDEALPLLAKLAAADRYEERPLIWKARLQMDAKKWDAAIVTLQAAIAIDPSDGEEGRGDRMRVYAFMSRALAAKGDKEKAAFFAGVVKSIRLSETADRWFEIGAYEHAIALYRQALGFFQDAYCIQSRLAVRLAAEGKMDEAAEHYRRAFELMPDSFGRVESHCFGCEHVFAGAKPQGVADRVFAQMLQARPEKPQLHYLSGYLREEQGRDAEAAEFYRQAVQLDPLYLNAWNRLAGLEEKLKFTPAQRDDLMLKLVELDPARRHASPDLEKVTDIPRLWRTLKDAAQVLTALPKPGALGELKASATQMARAKPGGSESFDSGAARRVDAASVLLQHHFVQALQTYLATINQPRNSEGEEPAGDVTLTK